MPRNRSATTSSLTNSPPAIISRGFASLRRRRPSNSSPPTIQQNENTTTNPLQILPLDSNTSSDVNLKPKIRLVPHIGVSTQSFVFDIIERELEHTSIYRIGRFSDRNSIDEKFSFKSKVVSRNHAELWTEGGKVYLKDVGSSSGTFINRLRLSGPGHVSLPHEIKDGDIIQFGVDYQGGVESIYRAVRIKVEINRQSQQVGSYNQTAFQQLRNQYMSTHNANDTCLHKEADDTIASTYTEHNLSDIVNRLPNNMCESDIQECCICLYAVAPFQALFVAPCSHVFHFKCLRPLILQNYPGFSCPLCRNYFDLEASVAVEVEEVLEAIQKAKQKINTVPEENEEEETHGTPVVDRNSNSLCQSSSNHSQLSILDNQQPNQNDLIKNIHTNQCISATSST